MKVIHHLPRVKIGLGGAVFKITFILLAISLSTSTAIPQNLTSQSIAAVQPDNFTTPEFNFLVSAKLIPYQSLLRNEAQKICQLYRQWFGPISSSYQQLTIADSVALSRLANRPKNLMLINQVPVPFTRLLQRTLAIEIARYWFGAEQITDPFLSHGLPAYAASRYLKTVYGDDNLLDLPISIPFLAGASDYYLHRIYFYLAAVNNLSQDLTAPEQVNDRFISDALYKSQAVLLLTALEKELGKQIIDSAIRNYRSKYILAANLTKSDSEAKIPLQPQTAGFISILTAIAGYEQELIINQLFRQTGTNDLKVTRVFRQGKNLNINLGARSPLNLPVVVRTVFTDQTSRTDTVLLTSTTRLTFATEKRVRMVIVDPENKILEPDRWNNIYPRRITFKPIFALPDFEAYQLFYGPWFWYDSYRGFQPGIWFQGRKFIDAGPARGEHNWTLIQNYSSKKSDWHTGCSYQTPLLFYPTRVRLYFAGDNSFRDRGLKLYLSSEFSNPFHLPRNELQFGYRLYELLDTTGRDPRAWERARVAELRVRFYHQGKKPGLAIQQELLYTQGLKPVLSEYDYAKISLVENITIAVGKLLPVSVRIFAGAITGSVPLQERFYLSGGLNYTPSEPVSWAYEGMASGQEHWHYDGDVNCRGYYGSYRSGKFAWGVNIYLLPCPRAHFPISLFQPFFDVGNVADSLNPALFKPVLDAGIRLKIGPLYADFPFWKSSPQAREKHFAFRWSLGFKLTELFSGI